MTAKLILIRGLPGSGKSTRAKLILEQNNKHSDEILHYEADMYFIDEKGNYQFNEALLSAAHQWCKEMTQQGLMSGKSVIVSNTFVQCWEIAPYYQMAKKHKVAFEVQECDGEFGSIHNVPKETIKNMKKRWQKWRNDLQS